MGFIQRYLLPKEVDFDAALLGQARIAREMVSCLHHVCASDDPAGLGGIEELARKGRSLKEKNMDELLDVFITPYDKESIYRMITQLDWVCLGVKHFALESEVYGIHSLGEYIPIVAVLRGMAEDLEGAVGELGGDGPSKAKVLELHDRYDTVVSLCASATAELLAQDDVKRIIRHKAMLLQLKEIAKRIHISANTLEDMALKIV